MLKVILFQCLTGVILEQYFPIFEHCVRNVMKLEQIIKWDVFVLNVQNDANFTHLNSYKRNKALVVIAQSIGE